MLKLGIDPEKLYRATFIRQYGLCCYNMASFLFDSYWANGLPPPLAKNFRYAYAAKVYKFICPIFRLDKTSLYQGLVLLRVPLGLHVQLTRIPSDKICFISSS